MLKSTISSCLSHCFFLDFLPSLTCSAGSRVKIPCKVFQRTAMNPHPKRRSLFFLASWVLCSIGQFISVFISSVNLCALQFRKVAQYGRACVRNSLWLLWTDLAISWNCVKVLQTKANYKTIYQMSVFNIVLLEGVVGNQDSTKRTTCPRVSSWLKNSLDQESCLCRPQ